MTQVRPPEHEYLRKLLYTDLAQETREPVLRQLRRCPWADPAFAAYAVKCFVRYVHGSGDDGGGFFSSLGCLAVCGEGGSGDVAVRRFPLLSLPMPRPVQLMFFVYVSFSDGAAAATARG